MPRDPAQPRPGDPTSLVTTKTGEVRSRLRPPHWTTDGEFT